MAKPIPPKVHQAPRQQRGPNVLEDSGKPQGPRAQAIVKEYIRNALQKLADRLHRRPTASEINALSRYTTETITQYFDDLDAAFTGVEIPPSPTVDPRAAQDQLRRVESGHAHPGMRPLLPVDVTERADFREVVLATAAHCGVVPRNVLEEAFVFQWLGVGAEYFRRHPLHSDVAAQEFRDYGAATLARLPRIKTLLTGEPLSRARLTLGYALNAKEEVVALYGVAPPATLPTSVNDELGFEVMKSWVAARGAPVAGDVLEALIRHAANAEWRGHTEYPFQSLEDLMATSSGDPIADLIAVAAVFDQTLATASEVRLSFRVHGFRHIFAQLELAPWHPGQTLGTNKVVGEMVFRKGDRWQLVQYQGYMTSKLADIFFATRVPLPKPGAVRDEDIQRVRNNGNIQLTDEQLKTVMATPRQRHMLMQTLWSRDHPGEPFPRRYAFKTRLEKSGASQVDMALRMKVVPLAPTQLPAFSGNFASLVFERDAAGVDRQLFFYGRGAQSLTLSVLRGDGLELGHPLERYIALRQLETAGETLLISPVMTSDDVLGFMAQHGSAAPQRLATVAHAVNPEFPLTPDVMALSGVESHGKVNRVRLWHGDVSREKLSDTYFWLQWARGADGHYTVTRVSRTFGKQLAQKMAEGKGSAGVGGLTIAPDGDGMVERADRLRPKPEGFTPLTGEMCKTQPLTTPAELVKIPPLEKLPVQLKDGERGFEATSLDWKKLAIPPSTERCADPVDLPEFIGSDTFLPEPPLGMVLACDALLVGGALVVGAAVLAAPELAAAMAVEVPSGVAAGIARGVQVVLNPARPTWVY